MANGIRPQQYRIGWPLSKEQVEHIDTMFETLFRQLRKTNNVATNTGSSGTSVVKTMGPPGEDGLDGEPGPPGPPGLAGTDGMVPYFIASGQTFTVPVYKQALFEMNIDNEGFLIVDGFLIEVN